MPVKFNGEVSFMDLVSIAIALSAALGAYYALGGGISANAKDIEYNAENIARLERVGEQHEIKMIRLLEEQKLELKDYRQESRDGRQQVVEKLDRLIERELNGN